VISSFVLPRIGAAHARRYFLTAEVFSAAEAHRIGLIHETTTAEKLDSKVQEICGLLLNNGPNALREAKALIRRVLRLPQEEAIPFCSDLTARIRTSPEGQEGLRAFLEKRAPSWMCP